MAKINVWGMWEKQDKNGQTYFQGKLPSGNLVMMFRNAKQREGKKDPDWNVLICDKVEKR